jgi:AsmA protein
VQVGSAIATWTDKKVLTGRLDADVRLSGKGGSADAIKRALDGTVEGTLADGVFHGTDLIAEITGPLAKAVPALRQKAGGGGSTSLGKLVPFSLRIQGGQALLQKPLEIEQRDATMSVRGSVGLDGELDLPLTLALSPVAVAELSGGRAKLQSPLPFIFTLKGKAWGPRLAGLDVKPAAKTLVETLGVQALGKALGLGGAGPAGQPVDAQSQPVKDKAQDAKRKLEQDAKKALKGLLGR